MTWRRFAVATLAPLLACQLLVDVGPEGDAAAPPDSGVVLQDAPGEGANPGADAADGSSCLGATPDSNTCGPCGRDCLAGECRDGGCQPFVLANATNPRELAMDGADLYWVADLADGGARVERVSKDGGAVTAASPDEPEIDRILLDSVYLYYSGDSVKRLRKDDTLLNAKYVFPAGAHYAMNAFALLGTDLYATIDNGSGTLWACPKEPTGQARLVDGPALSWPTTVTVAKGAIFVADSVTPPIGEPLIERVNATGTVDAIAVEPMVRSASDATHLWFTQYGQTSLLRLPLDAPPIDAGGGPSSIERFANGQGPASDLVVDATHVYWLTDEASGFLHRVARSGGPVETLVVDVRKGAGLAVDDRMICWGETDTKVVRCLAN